MTVNIQEWIRNFDKEIKDCMSLVVSLPNEGIEKKIESIYSSIDDLKKMNQEKHVLMYVKNRMHILNEFLKNFLTIQKNILNEHVCENKPVYSKSGQMDVDQKIGIIKNYG
jgi:hypothetical protein